MSREVYFSLGANLGDRQGNIDTALRRMSEAFGKDAEAVSDIFETEPWGFESDNRFLNCAVGYSLDLDCIEILSVCKGIEVSMGRDPHSPEYDRVGNRVYKSRIIDIDILLYGNERICSDTLTVPHPLMKSRQFVMEPLMQIVSPRTICAFPDIFGQDVGNISIFAGL